jgi:hypothetical protein
MPASSDKAQDRQSGRRLFEHAIQGRIGCWPVCDLEFPDPALQWHFRVFAGFHTMEDGDQSRPTIPFPRGTAERIKKGLLF